MATNDRSFRRTRKSRAQQTEEFRAAGAFIRVLETMDDATRRAWIHYLAERYLREPPTIPRHAAL